MKKKGFAIGMVLLLLCTFLGLSACVKEEADRGKFYSLQTAYDEGWLTVADLQNIASYVFPGDKPQPEPLNEQIAADIKKAEAKSLRIQLPDKKPAPSPDDVTLRYYGTYNDCVIVRLWDKFFSYPAVDEEMTVAGVKFEYSGPKPIVWKYD